jgi:hypothetical protein
MNGPLDDEDWDEVQKRAGALKWIGKDDTKLHLFAKKVTTDEG